MNEPIDHSTTPLHSIGHCPVCEAGLLGVRLCHGDPTGRLAAAAGLRHEGDTRRIHGLVICDECEAIWRTPDPQTPHELADAEHAVCPRCQTDLWQRSHWASLDEVSRLGWTESIDRELDFDPDANAAAENDLHPDDAPES